MPRTMRELNEAWYGYYNDSPIHYDSSRYYVEYGIMVSNLPNEYAFKRNLPFRDGPKREAPAEWLYGKTRMLQGPRKDYN